MRRLPSINPADTTVFPFASGQLEIGAVNKGSKILLYNMSPLNIDLDFLNGNTDMIHAWEANYWVLGDETPEIEWQIDADSLNVSNPPISRLFMTLYDAQERIQGTYPMAIMHQTSLGNQGGVNTNVSTLNNSGQPGGTTVITISDSLGNTFTLDNDGLLQLFTKVGAALVELVKTQAADPLLLLGAASHAVEILGDLYVDGNLQFNTVFSKVSSGADGVMAITGTGATQNTRLQSGGTINLQVPGGTSQAVVDNTGFTVGPGQLHLVVGDLRHFNGNTSTIGSGTVISHGLGITPRLVQLTSNIAQPGSANVGVGSFTATTFTASVGAGSSGCWLAIKE